jgi:hypothetical protein
MTQLSDFGNETVLHFIRNSIKKNNDVKKILDIKYVTGKVDDEEDKSSHGFLLRFFITLLLKSPCFLVFIVHSFAHFFLVHLSLLFILCFIVLVNLKSIYIYIIL